MKSILYRLQKKILAKSSFHSLECKDLLIDFSTADISCWQASSFKHVQVISPGRSGTRWLADTLLDTTNSFVCHSTNPTLAEVGYLFYKKQLTTPEVLGAYRQSRSKFHALSNLNDRYFIDLDCKNSPFASVIADHYPGSKFLIMLRDPIDFIRSGLNRGYYISRNPVAWGHLDADCDQFISKDPSVSQIYKIAFFWNALANLACEFYLRDIDRSYILPIDKMFQDPSVVADLLAFLNIAHKQPLKSRCFSNVRNQSRKFLDLSESQQECLQSKTLSDFCFRGMPNSFLHSCGFVIDG